MKSSHKTNATTLLVLVLVMCLFGLMMIYNASSVSALADFGDRYFYLKEQAKWLLVGFIGLVVSSRINYRLWAKLALPGIILTTVLLIGVFLPGIGISAYGAKRWINFGFFVLQPAELAKLALIIYLSAWLSNHEKNRLMAFLILIGVVVGLILLEPDLGTSMIVSLVAIVLYFVSGVKITQFMLLIPLMIVAAISAAVTSPYRMKRILTFLNPTQDPLGASYHIRQVLLGLGSGGLFGLGLGKSRQKYSYLPESTTDSIFAIIGEEIGFIGCLIFIALYLYLIYTCFKIVKMTRDKFGYLLASGITFWLAIQALINLSAMTVVLPLTGVPLPFISYGGSGLIVSMFAIGILININSQNK